MTELMPYIGAVVTVLFTIGFLLSFKEFKKIK